MKKTHLVALVLLSVLIAPGIAIADESTDALIAKLRAQIAQLTAQLTALQQAQNGGQTWCHTFNANLKFGDGGSVASTRDYSDVTDLQQALTKEGFSIDGSEYSGRTSVFGESTASAVTGFQEKYREEVLTPIGLKYGTGYVGKATRAKLNQLYGCGGGTMIAPQINSMYPQSGPVGTQITLAGTGFTPNKLGGCEGVTYPHACDPSSIGTNTVYFGPATILPWGWDIPLFGGKTLMFPVPDGYSPCPNSNPACGAFAQLQPGIYTVSVSNANGTSNEVSFTVTSTTAETIIKRVGEQEGSFLIQKINADNVEGLWYQQYPVAMSQGSPRTLYIGEDIGYACEGVSEKLASIDFSGQKITFTKVVSSPPPYGCPICLAGNTLIDTPSGSILVKDLQIGMPIWTTDKSGDRVSGIVAETSEVPVPPTHQMVQLVLKDGRQLLVSPGHPTVDGRSVGDLAEGDRYDGASVASVERVPYGESATYDILPSGETGFYWANGVLLGSTLSHQ